MTEIINVTIQNYSQLILNTAQAGDTCFDWCVQQQIVHSNNLELKIMLFPAIAFLFLLLYFEGENFEVLERNREFFVYMAKMFLIIFFATYLLIVRMRIIY